MFGDCEDFALVGLAIGSLPTPTRDYYNFTGWYDAASGGNKVDASKNLLYKCFYHNLRTLDFKARKRMGNRG